MIFQKERLKKYDKVFFIGLSGYRKAIENVKENTGYNIDIFPKRELATYRGKTRPLDMIEYRKQTKALRTSIIEAMPNFFPQEEEKQAATEHFKVSRKEMSLDGFLPATN